jgi:hypothetical protein
MKFSPLWVLAWIAAGLFGWWLGGAMLDAEKKRTTELIRQFCPSPSAGESPNG